MADSRELITLTLMGEDIDRISLALDKKAVRAEASSSYDDAEPYAKTRQRIDQQLPKHCL